jgi:outer membrane protein assembly factor BamB
MFRPSKLRTVVVGLLAVAAAATVLLWPRDRRPEAPVDGGRRGLAPPAGARWPIFRGSARLSGVAAGPLSAALRPAWRFAAGGPVRSSPVVADGRVVFGCDDGNVYAVRLADGRKLWARRTGYQVTAPPVILDDAVYVGSHDGNFYCLGARDGAVRWTVAAGGPIWGSAVPSPAPDGNGTRLVFAAESGSVVAVDADSGEEAWRRDANSQVRAAPTVLDGLVVVGGCTSKELIVLSARDGARVGAVEADDTMVVAAAGDPGGPRACAGLLGERVVWFSVRPPEVLWQCADPGGAVWSAPATDGRCVVFGSDDGKVYCRRAADGTPIWTFRTRGAVRGAPVLCGDKVVVGSDDGRLYVLARADGEPLWSFPIGPAITTAPAVVGGAVIVGCVDGSVYAFGPE